MPLKALLTKDEYSALSDDLKGVYEEDDSGESYTISVDDSTYKSKISEFRNNNVKLLKDMEVLKTTMKQFDGLDVEKAREAIRKMQEIEDKKLIDENKIDELVETRVSRMREELDGKVTAAVSRSKELEESNKLLEIKLGAALIDSQALQAITALGTPRKNSHGFIKHAANEIWKIKDGKAVPMKVNGDGSTQVIFGSDASEVMTMDEWAKGFAKDHPYVFESTKGGGGRDTDTSHSGDGKVVRRGDKKAYQDNIDKIATGEVKVI